MVGLTPTGVVSVSVMGTADGAMVAVSLLEIVARRCRRRDERSCRLERKCKPGYIDMEGAQYLRDVE